MGRKARISKGKQMKPNFFVFCEGETEIAYVKFLRSLYRAPIQVIVKKGKSNISEDYIERSQNEYVRTEQDKVFLMYDLDVDGMLEQLQKIPNAELIVSNPCIELWFLLHYQEQKSEISSVKCVQKYQKVSKGYKKGILSEEEKDVFTKNRESALERAKKLAAFQNPSTTVFKLLEELKG
ncbi:RloB family protein [Prevotella sp. E2-28]|uniref:RloB family protein n=1 Tax=Prevotella sp. E2-28 TaxID=2913620 RepID=UPI001EDA3F5A|nr:RloB family protein [Prevotella sp. E2-28]UKK54386.1 RloB family protein [Prevotella sp. E2-28]